VLSPAMRYLFASYHPRGSASWASRPILVHIVRIRPRNPTNLRNDASHVSTRSRTAWCDTPSSYGMVKRTLGYGISTPADASPTRTSSKASHLENSTVPNSVSHDTGA